MSTGTSTFVIRWVNFLTMLVAAAVIGYGVWMSSHHDGCRKSLTLPVMGLGSIIFLMYMVTNNGSGHTFAGLRYKEYQLQDYGSWFVKKDPKDCRDGDGINSTKIGGVVICPTWELAKQGQSRRVHKNRKASGCYLQRDLVCYLVDDLFRGVLCQTKRCQNALEILKGRYNNLLSSKATTPEEIESLDLEGKCKLRLEGPRLIETDERRILTRELETNL
ncbi:hypothetical protein L6452_06649 [Arctium lappa]|uniref:Uncharacterized protein n=1 Tax=Arctium lappa TaxID=4217 RepID=A0ACB9EK41_ARCLA|nr:hypothetical protein L6452_06649 [Arctium lappa]